MKRAFAANAVVLVVLSACGDRPPTPTQPGTTAGAGVPRSLRIEGPSSLAPGASTQYRAIVSFTDGSTKDVTTEARWRTADGELAPLLVDAPGIIRGASPGEADLTVFYPATLSTPDSEVISPGTVNATIRVLVLEPGTYRVSGTVTESALPFPGINVTVAAGKRAGLSAHTTSDGTYVLYGLAGPTDLMVSEEGLRTATRSIVVTDHQIGVDFSLQPLSGYDSVAGDWRLTVQASPSCGSELPQEAAIRTFATRITQRGPQLTFDLTSPERVILTDYPVNGHGGVSGASVSLYLQVDMQHNPPRWVLLERLDSRRFVGIAGSAQGQRIGNTVVGTLSGDFAVYRSAGADYAAPGTVLESRCFRKAGEDSSLHAFRLERR